MATRRARQSFALTIASVLIAGLVWFGCSDDQRNVPTSPAQLGVAQLQEQLATAMAVQNRHSPELFEISGVVGTGTALGEDGRPEIRVFTVRPGIAGIPNRLDDIPVRVEVTGMFVARAAQTDPTARFPRPTPIGVSTGHPDITAGTIGARVTNGSSLFALSNNHIYANSNDAVIGDSELQPGPFDGGSDPQDKIGELADFEPIDFSGADNTIDAAIAAIDFRDFDGDGDSENGVGFETPAEGYGAPNATIFGDSDGDGVFDNTTDLIDLLVQKYGRTTALTTGTIEAVNVEVDVCYECNGPFCFSCSKLAHFVDQISITPGEFSGGGDSGSLIVTNDTDAKPVGLLFAGSSSRTLANRIDRVLNRFNVTVDDGTATLEPVTDIAVTGVSAPSSVVEGDVVSVDVTVENVGNQDVTGDITVTLDDDTDVVQIGTQTISGGLAAGGSTTLTYSWDTNGATLGDHTLTASHDFADDDATNDSRSTTVNVAEASENIHVGDLDGNSINNGSTWTAEVTISVHDGSHNPVTSATVTLSWNSRDVTGIGSCTTDATGQCTVSVSNIPKRTGDVTFTVDDVSHETLTYDASANHDSDGDSDGTTIVVNKP